MNYIAILGRQPQLGMAELESQLGADKVLPFGDTATLIAESIELKHFGGLIRVGTVLATANHADWQQAVLKQAGELASETATGQGKIQLGISCFGIKNTPQQINRLALSAKKQFKAQGHSVRVIPNKQSELNAAQVLYNKLTVAQNIELLVVSNGQEVIIAKSTAVQDIDAYAKRDREKPVRDPQVGMLPPKLAQILINLTARRGGSLLDPFCGTGSLLMEAALMGFSVQGSDISGRMIDASQKNLNWLSSEYGLSIDQTLTAADARNHKWSPKIEALAAETYLGPPLMNMPQEAELKRIISEIDKLHRDFLINLSDQLESGQRIVLAIPAWQSKSGRLTSLPIVDDLKNLSYTRIRFEHINGELIYARPQQIVARQILVLVRN